MVGRGYFFYGPAYFQGQTVSFREGTLRAHRSTNQPIAWHRWPRCLLLQATLLQVAILEHIPPKPLKKQFFFLSHSSILTGLFEYIRCCEKSLFLEVKLLSFSTSDLFRELSEFEGRFANSKMPQTWYTLEDSHGPCPHGGLVQIIFLSKWVMTVGSMLIFQGVANHLWIVVAIEWWFPNLYI